MNSAAKSSLRLKSSHFDSGVGTTSNCWRALGVMCPPLSQRLSHQGCSHLHFPAVSPQAALLGLNVSRV